MMKTMRFGRYGWPYRWLRWGVGATFVLIGLDMMRHGDNWIGYVPEVVPGGLSREAGLKLAALFNLAVGLMLWLKVWPKVAGGLASVHLIAVLVVNRLDAVLMRDLGLLGASLALMFWPARHHRKKHIWQWRYWRKKQRFEGED